MTVPNLEKAEKAKKKYEEEVAKLTINKEIDDAVTNNENIGETNIDINKADGRNHGFRKKD